MLAHRLSIPLIGLQQRLSCGFAVKKKQMELTIRTPYRTICQDFTEFTRIIVKDNSSVLCIQNKMPGALHLLPPGYIKLKLTNDRSPISGTYLHLGGWLIIHNDNSCEINFMDAMEVSEVKASMIGKLDEKPMDTITGKYVTKIRSQSTKAILKKLT